MFVPPAEHSLTRCSLGKRVLKTRRCWRLFEKSQRGLLQRCIMGYLHNLMEIWVSHKHTESLRIPVHHNNVSSVSHTFIYLCQPSTNKWSPIKTFFFFFFFLQFFYFWRCLFTLTMRVGDTGLCYRHVPPLVLALFTTVLSIFNMSQHIFPSFLQMHHGGIHTVMLWS